jgi:hypothetical protein
MKRKKTIVIVCIGVMLAFAVYPFGIGVFIKWGERAPTRTEYIRRAEVRNTIYAPVIWLKSVDSTGSVKAFVQWQYRLSHEKAFDPNSLPPG